MRAPPYPLAPLTRIWDPRPEREADECSLHGACNLPLAELNRRAAELPPKGAIVWVAAEGELAREAERALYERGRIARIVPTLEVPIPKKRGRRRLWRPNPLLHTTARGLAAPGTALDLGCGSGREALFLASYGWHVTAVDVLADALEIAKELEARYSHPHAPRVSWKRVDLETDPSAISGSFDLVTAFRYLNRDLLRCWRDLLAPGGSLLVETFTETHRRRFGKPRREEFVLAQGELLALAEGLEVAGYSEGWRGGAHTARLWARRI